MSRLLGENLQATSFASSRNRCNIISYALKDVLPVKRAPLFTLSDLF